MDIMDVAVVSTHSDISTKTGEKIIAITVDRNLEEYIKSITEDNTK